jgi:multidrug transporter EmrE-like cation transporter
MPARASWGCVILSALFHVGYNLFLVRTYRVGDLGQTYPIARGSSPLLVSLGAALFAGELPDPIAMAGVLLVSGGIISLAFHGRRLGLDSLSYALTLDGHTIDRLAAKVTPSTEIRVHFRLN